MAHEDQEMSTIDFTQLNTRDGFKAFLQAYHQQLTSQRSFPPLGLQKALHTAAPAFGYNDWHVMSAALDRGTAAETANALEEPQRIVLATMTVFETDGETIQRVKAKACRDWDRADAWLADVVTTLASDNGRSIEEILECNAIDTPDEEALDEMGDDDEEILAWIVANNGRHQLIRFASYLDYNLTHIEMQEDVL